MMHIGRRHSPEFTLSGQSDPGWFRLGEGPILPIWVAVTECLDVRLLTHAGRTLPKTR